MTTLTARTDRVTGNGSRASDPAGEVEVPSGGQRRRIDLPQVLVAVLVVAGCAVGALVWANASRSRTPVLALATDISRGEALERGDVRIVNVDADTDVRSVPATSLDNFVGSVATADLEAGTLLTPAQFSAGAALGAGESVVGAALDVGEYPVPDLRTGDRVDAYLMPTASAAVRDGSSLAPDGAQAEAVSPEAVDPTEPTGDALDVRLLAGDVEVFDVAQTQSSVFVSLRVPTELAGDVAAAAGLGRLRLVLVPLVEEVGDG